MTSRVSFLKLVVETLRRHTAAVLITVLGFFIHIVTFFMNVQNVLSTQFIEEDYSIFPAINNTASEAEHIKEVLYELCAPSLVNGVIAMAFGAYLAFDFLRYMHSKSETDFYDSMPIRRQTWFKTIFTSCFLLFFVLSVITTGIETAIVFSTGYGSLTILQAILWNLICMIAAFLVTWVTTALAMIMTGHSIIAFLGFGVFASYIPLILANLILVYSQRFLDTYVYKEVSQKVYYFSPVTLVYKMTNSWYEWIIEEHWTYIIGCFAFALIIGIIAYLLFLRRPSEAAGRAMAFEKANSVIRFLIVIPLTLYGGLFLEEMASISSAAWLIFGVVFGAFLIHGIMECIFQFDIKALISKKRQLLVSIILCLGFVFIFWADLFQYDEYIPDAKDVKAVKIDTYLFDPNHNDIEDWNNGLTGEYVDDALAIVKDIMKSSEVSNNEDYNYVNDFVVTYQLKNGTTHQRCYSYYDNDFPESFDKLYATEEFKNDYCILYHLDEIDITSFMVNNGPEAFSLDLSEEELKKFYEMYLDEYTDLTFKQLVSEPAVFELVINYTADGENYRHSYDVYSSFTNTLAFLKEHGVVSFSESENIKLTNLEIYSGKMEYEESKYISNENQLKELQKYMIISDFMYNNYSDEYIYCDLRYEHDGATNYITVFLKSSDIDKVLSQ